MASTSPALNFRVRPSCPLGDSGWAAGHRVRERERGRDRDRRLCGCRRYCQQSTFSCSRPSGGGARSHATTSVPQAGVESGPDARALRGKLPRDGSVAGESEGDSTCSRRNRSRTFRVTGSSLPGTRSTLARKNHRFPAAAANLLVVTGRTPSRRFDVVSATPSAPFSPFGPSQRHLDGLATKIGDFSGPGSSPRFRPSSLGGSRRAARTTRPSGSRPSTDAPVLN